MKANSWNEFRPTPPTQEDSGEPFCWILKPTLQLKIKVNSSTKNEGQLLEWIQANSWNEFRPTPTPPREIQVNPFAEF